MRTAFCLVILLGFAGVAPAQAERYELGQRLKAFEKQWDKTTDEKLRKKALADLPKLTGLFFTNQFGQAGRTLDEARWILEGKQPSDDEKWAQSLYCDPETRFLEPGVGVLKVVVKSFYSLKANQPERLAVEFVVPGFVEPKRILLTKLPAAVTLQKIRIGDVYVRGSDIPLGMEVFLGDKSILKRSVDLSVGTDFGKGFPLAKDLSAREKKALAPDSIEAATALDRIETVAELSKGTAQETDIPAGKLLRELDEMMKLGEASKPFFTADRPGQFWLSIPVEKSRTACRLFVPKGLDPKKPVPLVVALHGAGGSENLFFEGYGDGQIVKLCEKRGWMLVAPRSGLSFVGGGPPVGEIVNELAKRYPIDPKAIFVVGHSMGAMQTIDSAQKYPGKFAGIAAFGGGGRVRKPELFADLPTFIGVGDKDFALAQARALKKSLEDGKAKSVTFQEYEGLEHLLICREALPDAFVMFDKVFKK